VRGATALFDRTEVRDWVAYLGLLANPTNELYLRRVLNVPRRGLGTVAVAELTRLAETRKISLLAALRSAHTLSRLTAEGRQGAAELVALLGRFAHRLRKARGADLAEESRMYLQATGLLGHIRRMERNPQVAEQRVAHLQMLIEGMAERPDQSLVDYLSDVAIEARSAGRAEHREGRDAVTLMTLHSSKGLEFSHVYLVGFEKGLLPHQRSLKNAAAIAEERRLCYVGMTRAKDRLTLTAARTRTRRNERLPRQPSPFLAEIPDELLDRSGEPETLTGVRRERNRRNLSKIYEILGVEPE
jgi:superfamily I DNA/RNA helicase